MKIVSNVEAILDTVTPISQGHNSVVAKARDTALNRDLIIKRVSYASVGDPAKYFEEAQRIALAQNERVMPIHYAAKDDASRQITLAMPFFAQGSLQGVLDAPGSPTLRECLDWMTDILLGLQHIHSVGLVHFDVKPSNVLLNDHRRGVISDFGQTMPLNTLGVATVPPLYPFHIPPECLLASKATIRADIYQAGLTFYRLVNGDHHFSDSKPGVSMADLRDLVLNGKLPDRSAFLPHVPKRLRTLIRKGLSVAPEMRPQTAVEYRNMLGGALCEPNWKCTNYSQTDARWEARVGKALWKIEQSQGASGWATSGTTTNAVAGSPRRRGRWSSGPYKTRKASDKALTDIFNEEVGRQ